MTSCRIRFPLALLSMATLSALPACGDKKTPPDTSVANTQTQPGKSGAAAKTNTQPTPPAATPLDTKAPASQADIFLLLPDSRTAMQEFQRNGLAMLVGRQAGYKLTTQDAAGSAVTQAKQFREAISAKPAAIIIEPIDPASLAAIIVEANTAGVTVIGLDQRMQNEGCTSVVYSDQKLVGRLAAQTVIEALKRKAELEGRKETTGRVVELRGVEDSFPTNEIAEGFAGTLKTEPGIIIVHDAPADWSAEKAAKCTEDAFRLQKNFDVIYAHSDVMATGAAKAAEAASQREHILILGTDGLAGQRRGVDLVRDAELDATIVRPALVDLALQIITKMRSDKTFKPLPAYEVKPMAVVPKNVDQCLRQGTYVLPQL